MIKTLISILLFCLPFYSICQQQYQSLLWEISGNNLEKKSYLYGTMHVSSKVAFRLDDVFYKALEKSDCIALESDPKNWLESTYKSMNLRMRNNNNSYRKGFYSNLFQLNPVNELAIRNAIKFDNRMINGYLYRKNARFDDFEEETYLDMFIYQAGKKKNKPIIGLENLNESRYLTSKAKLNSNKKKIDSWLQKLYSKERKGSVLVNAYRERNLNLLDSIGEATNTSHFREYMLYKRNTNMVVVLDSVMSQKSIFAGIGAAHLPGEQGVINKLREKGYTLKPLTSDATTYGKVEKNKYDNLFIKPSLKYHSTPDKFLSIKSFDSLHEFSFINQKHYLAPDMTNGAYLTITRFNRISYLPNQNPISWDRINSLLYEDIPGDIISKKELVEPFEGISIINKTKKGDYQKYHIYKTPLEFIIIKFGGKKRFVLDYEKEIFDSITFNKEASGLVTTTMPKKKYSFLFPDTYVSNNLDLPGKKIYQSLLDEDYYFFAESTINDVNYIEEDTFEAEYINYSFLQELDLEETQGQFTNGTYKSYESTAVIDTLKKTELHLKSIIKDGSYYLLGYIGNNKDKVAKYFSSIKFNTINYTGFKTEIDSSLHFTVKTVTKPPSALNPNKLFGFSSYKKKKPYQQTLEHTSYTTSSNEQIFISRLKFHDMFMVENIDSLWNRLETGRNKFHKKKYGANSRIFNTTESFKVNGKLRKKERDIYINKYTLQDSGSHKKILVKNILKKGVLFQLRTLFDSVSKPSKFVTEFYNSFTPKDTLLGRDIFEDKTDEYLDALIINDSIVLSPGFEIPFKEKNVKRLIDIIETHEFQENQYSIRTNLINKLGALNNPEVITFFKNLYYKSYSDPKVQIDILNSLSNLKTKKAYKTILELMNKDLPFSRRMSSQFLQTKPSDSLKLYATLFPEILKFTSLTEYKRDIYLLLAKVLDSNYVKPKTYRKYKDIIITDAKAELKRSLGLGKKYSNEINQSTGPLQAYLKILYPYKEDSKIRDFYNRLSLIKDPRVISLYYVQKIKADETLPNNFKETYINDILFYAQFISKLEKEKLIHKLNEKYIDKELFAKSKAFERSRVNKEKDSIFLIKTQKLITDDNKNVIVHIYKRKKSSSYGESFSIHYVALIDKKEKKINTEVYRKSNSNGIRLNAATKDKDIITNLLELVKHKKRKRIR